jgi:hypothetical protein
MRVILWAGALVCGLLVQTLFVFLRDIPVFGQIDATEATTDWILDRRADPATLQPPDRAKFFAPLVPFVIVDFDDNAMAAAGWPPATPGAAIANAVVSAVTQSALLIVVDIDAARISGDGAGSADLSSALRLSTRAGIGVLLVRETFGSIGGAGILPATPFDQLVRQSRNVRYASAALLRDPDGVIRHISPATRIVGKGRDALLPSAEAYIAAAVHVHDALRGFALVDGAAAKQPPLASGLVQELCLPGVAKACLRPETRTNFRFRWRRTESVTRLSGSSGGAKPLFFRLPGRAFLHPSVSGAAASRFKDSVALVMSTSQVARDTVRTPIGDMPGAIALLNAAVEMEIGKPLRVASAFATLFLSFVASSLTFLVWLGSLRLPQLYPELRSELVKTAALVFWTACSWLLFSRSAILAVVAPQYAVILFLIFADRKLHTIERRAR